MSGLVSSQLHRLLAILAGALLLACVGAVEMALSTKIKLGLKTVPPGDEAIRAFARRRRGQAAISTLVGVAGVIPFVLAIAHLAGRRPTTVWAYAFAMFFFAIGAGLAASALCFRCPCCGAYQGARPLLDNPYSAKFRRLRRTVCWHCRCPLDDQTDDTHRRGRTRHQIRP